MKNSYELIDSGDGQKLERFGAHRIIRPCFQAFWKPCFQDKWKHFDASFSRKDKQGWYFPSQLLQSWEVEIEDIRFLCRFTPFGHIGVFPEHAMIWKCLKENIHRKDRILSLFAYTGGTTLAAAKCGAQVCHVDASKPSVSWAKENARINSQSNIRWIVDDALKFLKREKRRGVLYDGIVIDPPTFGRGAKNEVFKIEENLAILLELCSSVLSKQAHFFIVSCHTPGITPNVLQNVLKQIFPNENVKGGELILSSKSSFSIPCGAFVKWER